ncbi:unnamed protein product [Rotaria socialis]|uniref:EF-hand domain-containing protein n=1 Tax=Rotaria socialis TaxID=392032 RepID=A0A817TRK8_9BILA|nr:unnamed protein product [Rotaria socialis]
MSFDAARAIFNQIDANKDGSIDTGEFNQWMSSAGGSGGAGAGAGFGGGSGSSYESSSFSSGGYGAGAGSAGVDFIAVDHGIICKIDTIIPNKSKH